MDRIWERREYINIPRQPADRQLGEAQTLSEQHNKQQQLVGTFSTFFHLPIFNPPRVQGQQACIQMNAIEIGSVTAMTQRNRYIIYFLKTLYIKYAAHIA